MKRKILVVDDEIDMVRLLHYTLASGGFEVLEAHTGFEAVRTAREHKPDLILLDVKLPDMNGFEVCRALKVEERTREVPVIMLTALDKEKDVRQGLRDGAVCFITKPYNGKDLLAEIKLALGENGMDKTDPLIDAA